MMTITEKKQPAYNLDKIKSIFQTVDDLHMTATATQGMFDLGFDYQDVLSAIQALIVFDVYKSMQPNHSAFINWQDVFIPVFKGIELYIKFQIDERGKIIVSFKEK